MWECVPLGETTYGRESPFYLCSASPLAVFLFAFANGLGPLPALIAAHRAMAWLRE
jgi:hypothetical protein